MANNSLAVGLAVGIPSGVILLFLLVIRWYTTHRMRKEDAKIVAQDKLNNIDLEGDLTFENYNQLAAPQSPKVPMNDEPVNRSKSKKFRNYSYHPSLKQGSYTPETDHSSSTNVASSKNESSSPNGSSSTVKTATVPVMPVPLGTRNSEQLLQNYFEGIVPVVPAASTADNSSADKPESSNNSQSDASIKKSKKSKSFFSRPDSGVNLSSLQKDESSDSLSQQNFIRSLNKGALESNDFHMPIPGSNRTSLVLDKKRPISSTSLARKENSVTSLTGLRQPNKPPAREFYIESDSDAVSKSEELTDTERPHKTMNDRTYSENSGVSGNPFDN